MPLRITRGCRLLAGARSRRGDRSATPASAARGGRRRCPCARPCLLASSSRCGALCPVSSPGEAGGSRGAPVCPHLLERRGMASHPAQSLWKNGRKALGQLEADVEPTRLASINVRQLEAGWGRHCSLARFLGSVLGLGSWARFPACCWQARPTSREPGAGTSGAFDWPFPAAKEQPSGAPFRPQVRSMVRPRSALVAEV